MQTRRTGQHKAKLTLSPRLHVKPLITVITAIDTLFLTITRRGSRGGEMGEFSPPPPFSDPPFFFSYSSNIEIIFDFSDIITKIRPPFRNPGSALDNGSENPFLWGRTYLYTKYKGVRASPEKKTGDWYTFNADSEGC